MTIAKVSARKCATNVIVSKGPDVCLTPVGGAVVPVAYSSIAFLDTAVRYSKSVRNNGKFDFQLNSRTANSTGNEPGTQFGLKVKGYMGHAHADVAAHFVYSEGWATVSHRDPAWINGVGLGAVEQRKAIGAVEMAASKNGRENNQFKAACKEIERQIGRPLTRNDMDRLHREISKDGCSFQDVIDIGVGLLG